MKIVGKIGPAKKFEPTAGYARGAFFFAIFVAVESGLQPS